MVKIKIENVKVNQKQTPLLVIGIFENELDFPQSKELNPDISDVIKDMLGNKEFYGTLGSSIVIHTLSDQPAKNIMLIGLGNRESFGNEIVRISAGKAVQKAKELYVKELCILPFLNLD